MKSAQKKDINGKVEPEKGPESDELEKIREFIRKRALENQVLQTLTDELRSSMTEKKKKKKK